MSPPIYDAIEQQAIAWVAHTVAYFDPDSAPESERLFARKALAELALLVAYRVRLGPAPLDAPYQQLLDKVVQIAARATYHERVARDHRVLLLYALTYAALYVCGRDQPDFRRIIEQALATRTPLIVERVPYRLLELLHFLHITRMVVPSPAVEDVFPQTLLAGAPNVVEINDSDAYAITHTIFYLTDFGLRPVPWPPGFELGEARELIDSLLRRYRNVGNADLVGELIASAICLGVTESAELARAWAFLQSRQEPDGRVPGPPGVVDEQKAALAGGPDYRNWITAYHTTMVVTLAAVMARQAAKAEYPVAQGNNSAAPVLHGPDREPARRAMHTALHWLGDQIASRDLARALRAGAGLALAWEFPGASSMISEGLHQLHGRLAAEGPATLPWDAVGADTMLLLAHGMQQAGITDGRVSEDVNALARSIDVARLATAPAAVPACALLTRLGKLDPRWVRRALRRIPPVRLAEVEAPDAVQCAAVLLQLSGGDPARLAGAGDEEERLVDQLSSGLFAAVHSYQLGDAATLLRALALIDRRTDRLTRDAISYLLSQQRPDGAFGYLAGAVEAPASADLHLAWTLALLWALFDTVFPQYSPTRLFSLALKPEPVP